MIRSLIAALFRNRRRFAQDWQDGRIAPGVADAMVAEGLASMGSASAWSAALDVMLGPNERGKVLRILCRPIWLRTAFWLAASFALVMAILPKPPQLPGAPSDKIQHIVAFIVLAGLAAAAYRRTSLIVIAAGLSAFGALIEFLQAIPALHRDSDIQDWVADTAASVFVLLIAWLWRLRSKNEPNPQPK